MPVADGAERVVYMRVRETGVAEIIEGLGDGGFFSLGNGRGSLEGDVLTFDFCANTGRYDDRIKALSISIEVKLTADEVKLIKKEKRDEDGPDAVVDPSVVVPDGSTGSGTSDPVLPISGDLQREG